jgi:hypothetical protein
MCVDYTDINKHYPTVGCDLLCFLDCYSGYHQIAIKEED